MSKHRKSPITRFTYSYYYYILLINHYINRLHPEVRHNLILRFLPLLHPQQLQSLYPERCDYNPYSGRGRYR